MQRHLDVMITNKRTRTLHTSEPEMPHAKKETSRLPATESDAATENGKDPEPIAMFPTGTAIGLAGSDIVAERMNPDVEISDTADPSDIVEVTPENLVNRNAPGSTTLKEKRANHGADGHEDPAKVIRRVTRGPDATGT